jgi:periplasmic divalent cation tolerance protein
MIEYLVVLCTVGSEEEGVRIAKELVSADLAACVNIVPKLRSVYRWKGKICDDPEMLLIIKTRKELFQKVNNRIVGLHSYEVPEVVAIPIVLGSEPYLRWLLEVTQPEAT